MKKSPNFLIIEALLELKNSENAGLIIIFIGLNSFIMILLIAVIVKLFIFQSNNETLFHILNAKIYALESTIKRLDYYTMEYIVNEKDTPANIKAKLDLLEKYKIQYGDLKDRPSSH